MWGFGKPEGANGPVLESAHNFLWADPKFANLSKIIPDRSHQSFLDRLLIYHRQHILDPLVGGLHSSEVGWFGRGTGFGFVRLCGELLHVRLHLVNSDRFQRDLIQLPLHETTFPREENQITASSGASAPCPTDTVDVNVRSGWDADLDDSRHPRIIDTSRRNVAGH